MGALGKPSILLFLSLLAPSLSFTCLEKRRSDTRDIFATNCPTFRSRLAGLSLQKDGSEEQVQKRSRVSLNRAGGRVRRDKRKLKGPTNEEPRPGLASWIAPLALVLILFNILSGGNSNGDASFYYYQSSYYESRQVDSNGQVQTARKESVRTNMPSLRTNMLEEKRTLTEDGIGRAFSNDFDQALEKDMEQMMMRFERTIFDDFF